MVDVALARFVDDQRAQVRCLLPQLSEADSLGAASQRALYAATVRAVHHALTGYFAECTQKRYQPNVWFSLLGCAGSFAAMRKVVPCEAHVIASWLAQEVDSGSSLAGMLATITAISAPELPQYRSSLLAATSLSERESQANAVIASSSSSAQVLTARELGQTWQVLESLILAERSQALEC